MGCAGEGDSAGSEGEDSAPVERVWREIATNYAPGALLSGWAGGADNVWLVGGEQGRSVVLYYDGQSWTERDPGLDQPLWWVHGFATGEVWVVGDQGATARWTGSEWQVHDSGAPGTTLYGVWGTTADTVWAVGGKSQAADAETREGDVLLRFEDGAWSRVDLPALDARPESGAKDLFKVWGGGPNHAIIVGSGGLALHWDGAQWRQEPTGGTTEPLFTVTGRSEDDVYAVGGLTRATLLRWDGAEWAPVELPAGTPSVVQGTFTAPGLPLFVAGWQGFVAELSLAGEWTLRETGSSQAYHAVFADPEQLWAVGGNIYSASPDYVGEIVTTRASVPKL
jgi:hypothetical protein